jgi:hypothetical protein
MGNAASSGVLSSDKNVFEKELVKLNALVNSILTEKNMFRNREYNFLSQDVCNQHYLLMESELNRHLKVNLEGLGEALYLVPKEEGAGRANKKEVCQKISNHYIKILYILCLIKYVYNLENHGDLSMSGILFRNIRVVDGIMEINFCNVPHKDYSKPLKDAYKIDFSKLEGLDFLTNYFLDPREAAIFTKVLRRILGRAPKKNVQAILCDYFQKTHLTGEHLKTLEDMFQKSYKDKLVCAAKPMTKPAEVSKPSKSNLYMYVEKDNPIFSREHCYEMHKYIIQLNTPSGKAVAAQYQQMKANYQKNVSEIESLLDMLVTKKTDGSWGLKNVSTKSLDDVIKRVKETIKLYYLQSLMDYHSLLDIGKTTPNINIMK